MYVVEVYAIYFTWKVVTKFSRSTCTLELTVEVMVRVGSSVYSVDTLKKL